MWLCATSNQAQNSRHTFENESHPVEFLINRNRTPVTATMPKNLPNASRKYGKIENCQVHPHLLKSKY